MRGSTSSTAADRPQLRPPWDSDQQFPQPNPVSSQGTTNSGGLTTDLQASAQPKTAPSASSDSGWGLSEQVSPANGSPDQQTNRRPPVTTSSGSLRTYAELVGVALDQLPGPYGKKRRLFLAVALALLILGGMLWFLTGHLHWLLLLFLLPIGVGCWLVVIQQRTRQYQQECADSLPDYLLLIAAGLRAGQTVEQALTAAVSAKGPLASEFARVQRLVRMGEPTPNALTDMATRINNKDLAWVAIAITINARLGGDLAVLLQTLANTLRERQVLRRTARSLAAEGRVSAWVLGCLPPGFLLLMALLAPSHLHSLFGQWRGLVLVGIALMLMIAGVLWLKRAVRLEV